MTTGRIAITYFPFTNLDQKKKRPALILKEVFYSTHLNLKTIAMITSQIESPSIEGDMLIRDWKQSGLLHPSRLRLAKLATIEGVLIETELGRLSDRDMKQVKKMFREYFSDWT